MTTIPCIENKCIKFPVCKHKKHIICDILYDYLRTIKNKSEIDYVKRRMSLKSTSLITREPQPDLIKDYSHPVICIK